MPEVLAREASHMVKLSGYEVLKVGPDTRSGTYRCFSCKATCTDHEQAPATVYGLLVTLATEKGDWEALVCRDCARREHLIW